MSKIWIAEKLWIRLIFTGNHRYKTESWIVFCLPSVNRLARGVVMRPVERRWSIPERTRRRALCFDLQAPSTRPSSARHNRRPPDRTEWVTDDLLHVRNTVLARRGGKRTPSKMRISPPLLPPPVPSGHRHTKWLDNKKTINNKPSISFNTYSEHTHKWCNDITKILF